MYWHFPVANKIKMIKTKCKLLVFNFVYHFTLLLMTCYFLQIEIKNNLRTLGMHRKDIRYEDYLNMT